MDSTHEERRKFSRIDMRAYADEHRCRVAKGQQNHEVMLIDISPGGARLKRPEPPGALPLARGERIVLDAKLQSDRTALHNIEAEIRWVGAIDFGVQFAPELDMTAGDLQRLLAG